MESIPDGRRDNTHHSSDGARVVSRRLADAVGEAVPELKKHIRHYDYVVSDKGRGDFMTLQEAVDVIPENTKATILLLDGTFNRPAMQKGIRIETRQTAKLLK